MKYQKLFRIHDNPIKIHLRVQIIKDFLKGMDLTDISRKENCSIKTVKKWVDEYKSYLNKKGKKINPGGVDEDFDFIQKKEYVGYLFLIKLEIIY